MDDRPDEPDPADRCAPLRRRLEQLDDEVAQLREDLSDFDIPPDLRERLQALLDQRLAARRSVLSDLEECEAQPVAPT